MMFAVGGLSAMISAIVSVAVIVAILVIAIIVLVKIVKIEKMLRSDGAQPGNVPAKEKKDVSAVSSPDYGNGVNAVGGSGYGDQAYASSQDYGGIHGTGGMDGTMMQSPEGADGLTVGLWQRTPKEYLTLVNLDRQNAVYQVPLKDFVSIGRTEGDILIMGDDEVSGKHCTIIRRGNLFYVRDDGSKNGTFYENMRVGDEMPIVNGGMLKIGRYRYRVEIG